MFIIYQWIHYNIFKLKITLFYHMSLIQLVGHCILYVGIKVRAQTISIINLKNGISSHYDTSQKKNISLIIFIKYL
jgi:hypothetical protein